MKWRTRFHISVLILDLLALALSGCGSLTPVPVSSLDGLNPPLLTDAYEIRKSDYQPDGYILSFDYSSHMSASDAERQLQQAMEAGGWTSIRSAEYWYRIPSTEETWTNHNSCYARGQDIIELIIHETHTPSGQPLTITISSVKTIDKALNCR